MTRVVPWTRGRGCARLALWTNRSRSRERRGRLELPTSNRDAKERGTKSSRRVCRRFGVAGRSVWTIGTEMVTNEFCPGRPVLVSNRVRPFGGNSCDEAARRIVQPKIVPVGIRGWVRHERHRGRHRRVDLGARAHRGRREPRRRTGAKRESYARVDGIRSSPRCGCRSSDPGGHEGTAVPPPMASA